MSSNLVFFVKHGSNPPVKIETHFDRLGAPRPRPLTDVADATDALAPLFAASPSDHLSLHLPAAVLRASSGLGAACFLSEESESDSTLDPAMPAKLKPYLSDPDKGAFSKECLEFRLDVRQTNYNFGDENNIKVLLGVSGAGKTRLLLEHLYIEFGYYFVTATDAMDFGSEDLSECRRICMDNPKKTKDYITLLYFVRYFVCNHLIVNKYCSKPHEILLAQLHPKLFFGSDIFCKLFLELLAKSSDRLVVLSLEDAFGFVAIDEIQATLQGAKVFSLPNSANERPFFSPLVYYSKHFGHFKKFILSGTGIDFDLLNDFSMSGAMKASRATDFQLISPFQPMNQEQVVNYSRWVLTEKGMLAKDIEVFINGVSDFSLCFGRARFSAFLIDQFLGHQDLELAFSSDTLDRICSEGIMMFIMKGIATLPVSNQDAAYACHYGLGFCITSESGSSISSLRLSELAVIDCLRYLIPFGDIVIKFAQKMASFPQPQMVGYFLEYLVAFALVANLNPGNEAVLRTICVSNASVADYCHLPNQPHFIMLPNHCCGPDIIYNHNGEIHIVQVKFVDTLSKQERLNALHTTNPSRFYWNSKSNCVLKGFEKDRDAILEILKGKTVFRKVFLHTRTSATSGIDGNTLINETSAPQFFDCLNPKMWEFLNSMRESFVKSKRPKKT
ncbi:hypothetical protein BDR26DRAFT_913465 [Obelidium mucronatum]|nr:hypothetical protein BDR26DRAFT_913465 [Obelidium mucronatum]